MPSEEELRRRISRLEDRVDDDVVLERSYSKDVRNIERRIKVIEDAIRDQVETQVTTYRAVLLMFIAVLIEAAVIALKLGG